MTLLCLLQWPLLVASSAVNARDSPGHAHLAITEACGHLQDHATGSWQPTAPVKCERFRCGTLDGASSQC